MDTTKGTKAMTTIVLHDPTSTVRALGEQVEARALLRCSVCHERVERVSQLDSSARCTECAP